MNGNKETINLKFNKVENTNKDEIIKILCLKVNALEEKCKINYEKNMALEEKCKMLEKNYQKILSFVELMMKKEEEKKKINFNGKNMIIANY